MEYSILNSNFQALAEFEFECIFEYLDFIFDFTDPMSNCIS